MCKGALAAIIFLIMAFLIVSPAYSNAICKDYGRPNPVCVQCSDDNSNYTLDQAHQNNLKLLLESLPSNTSLNGFSCISVGDDAQRVYGRALCRGDINQPNCQDCVKNASSGILNECESREAIIWNDLCEVHYSIFTIASNYAGQYPQRNFQEKNISDHYNFQQVLVCLMNNLSAEAAYSENMFATGEAKFNKNTIYGLVQCTRDMTNSTCYNCLTSAWEDLNGCCSSQEGGTVVSGDCNVRFELDRFYNAPSFLVSCTAPRGNQWKREILAAVICIPTLVVAVLIGSYVAYCMLKKRKQKVVETSDHALLADLASPEVVSSEELPFMDLPTIRTATLDFADSNKLGQGGFGTVYKGVLSNGKEVAVKRLSRKSWQGLEEFKNEILLIAKLQHRNLVKLLGCGIEGEEKLLIYEYMPNKSLDLFIFDSERRPQLDWKTCYNIIGGIARGLLYLHEDSRLKIIHRDLKPNNVLLDSEMVAKISDFGMARIFCENQKTANTRRVVGTYGYMAPEYAMEGLFSVKSDVFSFGVIVLEIISGKRNSGFYLREQGPTLLAYAWRLWNEGKALELPDLSLLESNSIQEVMRCIHIGLLCVQEDPADRPTMSSVAAILGAESVSLSEPRKPAIPVGRAIPIHQPLTTDPSENMITVSSVSPH